MFLPSRTQWLYFNICVYVQLSNFHLFLCQSARGKFEHFTFFCYSLFLAAAIPQTTTGHCERAHPSRAHPSSLYVHKIKAASQLPVHFFFFFYLQDPHRSLCSTVIITSMCLSHQNTVALLSHSLLP